MAGWQAQPSQVPPQTAACQAHHHVHLTGHPSRSACLPLPHTRHPRLGAAQPLPVTCSTQRPFGWRRLWRQTGAQA